MHLAAASAAPFATALHAPSVPQALQAGGREPALDRLARLAALATDTSAAAVVFFDHGALRYKGSHGELPTPAAAADAIGIDAQRRGEALTLRALDESPWAGHPWVAQPPGLRFFASAPLRNRQRVLGALWLLDTIDRSLSPHARAALDAVAAECEDWLARRLEADESALRKPSIRIETPPGARSGSWAGDPATQRILWSAEAAALHEMAGTRSLAFDELVDLYVDGSRAALDGSLRRCIDEGTVFEQDCEFRTASGRRIWLRCSGWPVRDPEGSVVRIDGTVQDITPQKEAEAALRESEERFKYAARATADAVWDWDLVDDTIWWNDGLETLFGIPLDAMPAPSSGWKQRIHPDDELRVLESIAAVVHSGGEHWQDEYRFRCQNDSYLHVRDRGFVIRDADGVPVRMVGGMADCTEQKLAEADAARDARVRAEIVRVQHDLGGPELDLQAVMVRIAESACLLTGASGAAVELLEGDHTVRRGVAGPAARRLGGTLPLEGSLSGLVVKSGETMVSEDASIDPRMHQESLEPDEPRSVIATPLRSGLETIGVLKVLGRRAHAFGEREVNTLRILAETLAVTLQRYRMAQQQRASEAQYRLLFQNNPQPMWVNTVDDLRFLAVNQAMVRHYGWSDGELLGSTIRTIYPPEDVEALAARLRTQPPETRTRRMLQRHRRADGGIIDVELSSEPIEFAGTAARLVLAQDVTEQLRAGRELARLSRAREMLSACNDMLVHAGSESALLEEVCRITVEIGRYGMAWVGFARDDDAKTIELVASAGADSEALEEVRSSWARDESSWAREDLLGHGPAGRAVRGGQAVMVDDMLLPNAFDDGEPPAGGFDALAGSWRERARRRGIRSVIALPLVHAEHTFGVLCLYAPEVLQAHQDEVGLLQELAKNLAFGIANLRSRASEHRMQAAVVKMAAAVSAVSGTEFMEQLVRNMVDALGAQGGVLVRLVPGAPEPAGHGRTVVVVAGGSLLENFDYALTGSPCESWVDADEWVVPRHVGRKYPDSAVLQRIPAEGYAGRCLENSQGQVMGLLLALFAQPLEEADFAVSTLQVFAARAAAEMERQSADAHIRYQASLLDKAQDAIMVRGLDGRLVFWNRSAERLYGWSSDEALGRSDAGLLGDDGTAWRTAEAAVMAQGEWNGEMRKRRKDGSDITVDARWTLVKNERGEPQSVLCLDTDITERKATEREIQKLAFYDPLTTLPNRMLLMDRLQQAVANCTRTKRGGALLFIDLDNFKTLNDTLGHDQGDLLLQQVAARLAACVREVDTVARLGGDEFVVMLEDLSDDADELALQARFVGEKVLSALETPYQIGGFEHQSTSSIGIAPFRDQHVSVGELLKQADLAMYQAKTAGRNTLRFFDPGMQAVVTARAGMETDLRQALAMGELTLHYQPQVDGSGDITGVEALVRWRHPGRGMVEPGAFIPLAEETGMILPLGQWVLRTACAVLAEWALQPQSAQRTMAVNVSARQFRHPDFVQHVLDVLVQTGAPAQRLKLELTESLLVEDLEGTVAKMTALKTHGVGFALDDFGTGYSSLSYLKRLPLDQLKIDQSFVRDVLTDANDAAIVRTIIGLAQSLGLEVIGEGVETELQRQFLAEHRCYACQGYLFSRPVPIEELAALFLRLG